MTVAPCSYSHLVPPPLREKIEACGQQHVLKFVDFPPLSQHGKEEEVLKFLENLEKIADKFEDVKSAMKAGMAELEADDSAKASEITPPPSSLVASLDSMSSDVLSNLEKIGLDKIARGEVAACVLAGGQGTRMGLEKDESKGMLKIGLPSGKSIFQLFCERLLRLKSLASQVAGVDIDQVYLPFLVMTSPLNHARVSRFFEENKHFGMKPEDVMFFPQGTLPALTKEGSLILEEPYKISEGPDGNGGIYFALENEGILNRIKEKGVKFLHVFSVDNAILRPCDPRFLGYCIEKKAEVGNKVVWKKSWDEKVGVIAEKDGQTTVVEYSELYNPDLGVDREVVRKVDENGKLVLGAGNICNHFYSLEFLEKMLPKLKTAYHLAFKKMKSVDENGVSQTPSSPNAIKLEAFIFDAFKLAEKSVVFEAKREEEFTPMKNPEGAESDSPGQAREAIFNLHKRWIEEAGGQVEGEGPIEISPLVSYGGEQLKDLVEGKTFETPLCL